MSWFDPSKLHAVMVEAFESSGLSGAELGRRMGVDRRRVSEILHGGRAFLTPELAAQWFGALDLELHLMVSEGVPAELVTDLDDERRALLRDVVRWLPSVPDDDVPTLRAILARFANVPPDVLHSAGPRVDGRG